MVIVSKEALKVLSYEIVWIYVLYCSRCGILKEMMFNINILYITKFTNSLITRWFGISPTTNFSMDIMTIDSTLHNIHFGLYTCKIGKLVLISQIRIDRMFIVIWLLLDVDFIIIPYQIFKLHKFVRFNIIDTTFLTIFFVFQSLRETSNSLAQPLLNLR